MCLSPDNWVSATESTTIFIFSTQPVLHWLGRIFQCKVMCKHWSDGWVLFYSTYAFLWQDSQRRSEFHLELPLAEDCVQKINTLRYSKPVCYLSLCRILKAVNNIKKNQEKASALDLNENTWMRTWRGLSQDGTRHLIKNRNAVSGRWEERMNDGSDRERAGEYIYWMNKHSDQHKKEIRQKFRLTLSLLPSLSRDVQMSRWHSSSHCCYGVCESTPLSAHS